VDCLADPSLLQAPYSFLDDLNSPNLLSQAELDEIAGDPDANAGVSESNSSNNSESDQDEVAKVHEEFISNENASSGLTVCLDYL
jgi:hypothetical protein